MILHSKLWVSWSLSDCSICMGLEIDFVSSLRNFHSVTQNRFFKMVLTTVWFTMCDSQFWEFKVSFVLLWIIKECWLFTITITITIIMLCRRFRQTVDRTKTIDETKPLGEKQVDVFNLRECTVGSRQLQLKLVCFAKIFLSWKLKLILKQLKNKCVDVFLCGSG